MKRVSKEGNRSNACKRPAVSSAVAAFVYRASEVTEGKVCGPENDEMSSMNSVLKERKEPPRKDEGISNVWPTLREWTLSALRDGAGSSKCSAIRSICD